MDIKESMTISIATCLLCLPTLTWPLAGRIQVLPLVSHVLVVDIVREATVELRGHKVNSKCVPERPKRVALFGIAAFRVVARDVTEGWWDMRGQ